MLTQSLFWHILRPLAFTAKGSRLSLALRAGVVLLVLSYFLAAFADASAAPPLLGYKLPYLAGKSYPVTQGWNTGNHTGKEAYAVDFGMAPGEVVEAAKAGRIKQAVFDSNTSGCNPSYRLGANYIIIAHDDGYESVYLHLQQNSQFSGVSVGMPVQQGQPLARSGNTGYSCGPHLHMRVQIPGGRSGQSVPFYFDEIGGEPKFGQSYVSTNTEAKPVGEFILHKSTGLQETWDNFAFLMTDWDNDGRPDLVGIEKSYSLSGTTEVHILSGASNFQQFLIETDTRLHPTGDNFEFAMTDWNKDGKPDLVAIKKSDTTTGTTEVHIFSGAANFQQLLLETGTALPRTYNNFVFTMADWDKDGRADLVAIKKNGTNTGTVEVHILSGASNFQQFILQIGTALPQDYNKFAFTMTDWDKDGKPDLVAIKQSSTASHNTEVHILSGASNFKQFIFHTATELEETYSNFAFAVADWNNDARPDLVAIKKNDTESRTTEVHILRL